MRVFGNSADIVRRLVVSTLVFGAAIPTVTLAQSNTAAEVQERARHTQEVHRANETLEGWQTQEAKNLKSYLPLRGTPQGPNEDFDMQIDTKKVPMRVQPLADARRDAATFELVNDYYSGQGLDRYMGLFVESGAAHSEGYQWNTQRWAGFAVKKLRDQFLDAASSSGVKNIRLGINIHELDTTRPETLDGILDFHRQAWRRGISITDSVLFFSGLKSMETKRANGEIDAEHSYQNNPKFPAYSERMAEFVLSAVFKEQRLFNEANSLLPISERKPVAKTAINPVNEPETFAGFNHFWNNGLANWGDPNVMRLYVPTIINIARANVRIRLATERAARGERILFFHNEAMTPPNYPSHQGDLQFAISKLMLGDVQLMNANFESLRAESLETMSARYEANKKAGSLNIVEACILKYANIPANDTSAKRETAKASIIELLSSLQAEHLNYQKLTSKTAKTDTMVMFDYYQQSEFILPKSVPELVHDYSRAHGEELMRVLNISSDEGFMQVLAERTRQAEAATGQKIWSNFSSRNAVDFEKLLSSEDGIVLDKLMGLRNEWNLRSDEKSVQRRQRAGFNNSSFQSDEKRIDGFLSDLLANDAASLKKALGVSTDKELSDALKAEGADLALGSLRDILNASERTVLHQIFGLDRARRTGFLPPHYARQTRAGLRKGFYEIFLNYVNELGIRVGGIGESGTPYYPWAATVHKQMMLALVAAAKASDFYVVRNDIGPAVGTVGWMSGPMIGSLKTNGQRGQDGVFKLVRTGKNQFEYQLSAWPGSKPWFSMYREDLLQGLSRQPRSAPRVCNKVFGP